MEEPKPKLTGLKKAEYYIRIGVIIYFALAVSLWVYETIKIVNQPECYCDRRN